jgi:hypothetical protein
MRGPEAGSSWQEVRTLQRSPIFLEGRPTISEGERRINGPHLM